MKRGQDRHISIEEDIKSSTSTHYNHIFRAHAKYDPQDDVNVLDFQVRRNWCEEEWSSVYGEDGYNP